ncbi:MAG TPA: DNA cytosine methyltransferase [Candidatus Paceibacterota bacterium]
MKTQLDMSEINKIEKNGYNVVSLFSGCGGSSLGYKLAGFDVKLAVEFIPNAIEVYKLNHPKTIMLDKDVRDINGDEILNLIGIKKYELDILDGSPPCSGFSINGLKEKGWGKVRHYSSTTQRVDDLFFEYARIVKDIMPKVFIAENVKGLTMGKSKEVLQEILETLRNIGYKVEFKVLDASDYNVPQKRERTILIGVRNDLNIEPVFPKSTGTKMSCKEAIGDLINNGTDQENHSKREDQIKKYFHAGCTSEDIKYICKKNNIKVYEQSFRRDKWEEPYYTIKQHHTRPYHPQVDRLMSIDEAKRIQTFPDDLILPHSPTQNWERIGRAVPPNLMKAIAECVRDNILNKINTL